MNIDRRCDSYSKPLSVYTNEIVQCGGKRGGSVKIEQTGCVNHLHFYEMKLYGTGKYYYIQVIRELPLKIKQYKD